MANNNEQQPVRKTWIMYKKSVKEIKFNTSILPTMSDYDHITDEGTYTVRVLSSCTKAGNVDSINKNAEGGKYCKSYKGIAADGTNSFDDDSYGNDGTDIYRRLVKICLPEGVWIKPIKIRGNCVVIIYACDDSGCWDTIYSGGFHSIRFDHYMNITSDKYYNKFIVVTHSYYNGVAKRGYVTFGNFNIVEGYKKFKKK